MRKELKKIDIHSDYVLWQMMCQLRTQLHTITAYVQAITPYCEAYNLFYLYQETLQEKFDILENSLQETIEARKEKH